MTKFCLYLLTFLTLLVPQNNLLLLFLNIFFFSWLSLGVFPRRLVLFLNLLLLLFFYSRWTPSVIAVVAAAYLFALSLRKFKNLLPVLLILELFLISYSGFLKLAPILNHDPGVSYATDMRAFLKTYYLIKQGGDFPASFKQAMHGANNNPSVDLSAFREPFLFHLWSFLAPSGEIIYLWFIILLFCSGFSLYHLSKMFLPSSLLTLPLGLVLPYFYHPLTDLTFLQVEWWGLLFFIMGLYFFFRRHSLATGVFFSLSLLCREHFLLAIAPLTVFYLVKTRRWQILVPLFAYVFYYFALYFPLISSSSQSMLRPGGSGNWKLIRLTLSYSSWNYLLGIYSPLLLVMAASSAVTIIKRRFIFALTFLPFFFVFLLLAQFGLMTKWNDYWGIYYLPLVLIFLPFTLYENNR